MCSWCRWCQTTCGMVKSGLPLTPSIVAASSGTHKEQRVMVLDGNVDFCHMVQPSRVIASRNTLPFSCRDNSPPQGLDCSTTTTGRPAKASKSGPHP